MTIYTSVSSEIVKPQKEAPALAKLKSRWLLQPGEKMDWKMRFEPRQVGEFSHTYVLELVSTNRQYTVTGHGNCVLPFFNTAPTAIFSKVSESVPEDKNYTCTYFIDKEAFDFGFVVTSKPKEKRVHQMVTNFKFENISLLPANIEFTFAEKTVDKVDGFRIEPNTLLVQVICNVVKFEFEIDTRNISFDHTLLHHKDVKTLNLINKCPVPLVWKFFGIDTLKEEFEISVIEGFLGPHDKKEVKFTHLASRVQVISKKPLKLEVFIDEGLMEPVFSEIIYLSAETFDVSVDVQFAQSDVNQVDFGKIQVGHESKQTLTLKNRGKYDITFNAVIINDPSVNVSNIEDLIKLNTFSGTLAHGEKPFIIQVIAKPEIELEISSVPLLKFSIFHSQYKNTIVAVIPVCVSLTSVYARFKILPLPDINFGPMVVGSKKTLEFIIQNIGIFEFKYTIVKTTKESSYEVKLLDGSAPIKKVKGMEKSESKVTFPKLSARGNRRLDTNSLNAGPFTLSSLTGIVDPGQMVVLLVECCPDTLGSFHEEIIINVSDCHPDFKRGTSIQLLSQGFIPTVDYTNFDDIFKEHYICDSLTSFHCKVEAGSHCVFIKDEGKLLFRNVCVGTKFPARLRLYNPTLVPCTLYLSTTITKGAKSTESAFSVTPPKLTISPYMTETLTVTFSPTLMEMYSASFEILIEMPAPAKPVKVIFKLAGEGCIPEVAIVLPKEKGRHGHKLLSFCPTILGDVTTRQFSFTNVGVLPCKFATFDVQFQPQHISTYEGEVKLFIVDNPFENLSIILTGEGYMEDITLEGLSPERFSHKSLTQKQDGDFELPCYQLDYGFCYINKIQKRNFKMTNRSDSNTYRFEWKPHPNILELQCTIANINLLSPNLGTTAWDDRQKVTSWRKETNPANSNPGSFSSFMSQELSIVKLQEYRLKVVDMEDEPDHEIISGTVRSFSLLVSAVADYTKCSYSTYHIHFKDTLMFQNCVCELTHTNTGSVPLEYKWIISVDESLPIRPSSAALLRSMELADEGLSQGSTFSRPMSALLPSKEQLFKDTSCERMATAWKRPRPLTGKETLLNTSAPGSYLFSRAAELSDRSNDSWAENDYFPFRVEPERGFLRPEECVNVKIIFSPLDVFNYKAKLSCYIPNLHPDQKPAEIVIKARSLMPYCYFDIEESDYLSNGRRNPCLGGVGFNQPPDPQTKVLEFNVMGVGVTTTKKFNIINPTEQNYSFSWRCDSMVTKGALQPFHCPSLDGWVESGKQTEIQFSFTAQDVGIFESFWTFCILEHDIETPFLLLGVVTEPSIGFVTSHVNLTPTLKGIKTSKQISLNNNEDVDMSFSFDPNSLFSDDHLEHLSINPAAGIIPAHSEQPIE
uniref:MSP domain-containing protein n=1 Tax=Timema poppense TaxID=170557 RepID=A0A7R9CJE6_TIMPO|nr:unnamed protein product [Timema poppensis]